MIVVDASVLANVIGDDGADGQRTRGVLRAAGDVAAPDLVDVETVAVLRKRWLAGTISDRRFASAIADLEQLPISRYPTLPLMRRAFELRANVTTYDASYVALAEFLGCELLTGDQRLAGAPGPSCTIRLLPVITAPGCDR
ncbi:MAG: type II toxin-antitoxin system VapC family toxin [Solirubrobacteraceae bacterium]